MKASFDGRVHADAAKRDFDKKATLADGREVDAKVKGVVFEVIHGERSHMHDIEALSDAHLDEMLAAIKAGKRATVTVEIHDDEA